MTMGLTLRRTARRINRLNGASTLILSGYPHSHPRVPGAPYSWSQILAAAVVLTLLFDLRLHLASAIIRSARYPNAGVVSSSLMRIEQKYHLTVSEENKTCELIVREGFDYEVLKSGIEALGYKVVVTVVDQQKRRTIDPSEHV